MVTKVQFATEFFLLKNALSSVECDALIASAEQREFEAAPITTAFGFERRPEIRNNSRVMFDDVDLAQRLWAKFGEFMPEDLDGWTAVGLNERFRFYRYDPGQRFAPHRDGYYRRDTGERSKLTFMIYLNSGFGGGATIFDLTTIRPQQGMALVFQHGLLHEGAPVTSGRKYVLRSDVMYRPPLPPSDG